MAKIRIGTSGWSYEGWEKTFYPGDLSKEDYLPYYAKHLDAVEINASFYSLPKAETLKSWGDSTASDFRFAMKASRYITHMKKLKDPKDSLESFMEVVPKLGKKLGPILFQLPPSWNVDRKRLSAFLEALTQKYSANRYLYVFEFRDPSWFADDVIEMLREHEVAFCIYDLKSSLSPFRVTADFVYIRLHGPDEAYKGSYSKEALKGWSQKCKSWRDEGYDVWCFFDNDEKGYAIDNALQLKDYVE